MKRADREQARSLEKEEPKRARHQRPHRNQLWRNLQLQVGTFALALLLFGPWTSPAQARDMTGKGGIGLLESLNSDLRRPPAFAFRYWQTSWAIEALVAVDWLQRNQPQDDLREAQAGMGLMFRVLDTMELSLSLGLRAWAHYTWTISDPAGEEESWLGLLFEVPLQAEYFLSDHSSIVASLGPSLLATQRLKTSLRSNSGARRDLSGPDSDLDKRGGVLLQLGGHYSGGLGFTYYF